MIILMSMRIVIRATVRYDYPDAYENCYQLLSDMIILMHTRMVIR